MFKQCDKHYHQWLHSSIHFKTKSCQSPSDFVRKQGPSKRTSSDFLYPVERVEYRHNRKGGKCKISRVLQLPVSCTQASPKMEASNRLKQAQKGNSRVHQNLPDSRGMGVLDRPVRWLSSHPHPPKLKEVPVVLPQFTGVQIHLPPFWPIAMAPQVFTMIVKEVKLVVLTRESDFPIPG